jgi:hypothetical protein
MRSLLFWFVMHHTSPGEQKPAAMTAICSLQVTTQYCDAQPTGHAMNWISWRPVDKSQFYRPQTPNVPVIFIHHLITIFHQISATSYVGRFEVLTPLLLKSARMWHRLDCLTPQVEIKNYSPNNTASHFIKLGFFLGYLTMLSKLLILHSTE